LLNWRERASGATVKRIAPSRAPKNILAYGTGNLDVAANALSSAVA
jgi:hypothetical protein